METIKPDQSNEEIIGRTFATAGLVAYQSGSVVSRTIVNQKTGTVTLFAFDQGQSLSEHSAPFDALVFGLDGQADIAIDGQPHRVQAGEMIIMPANRPHGLKAVSAFKMALVMIRS